MQDRIDTPPDSDVRPRTASKNVPHALRIAERRFSIACKGWARVAAEFNGELAALDAGERRDLSGLERSAQNLHRYTMLARQVGAALLRERGRLGR